MPPPAEPLDSTSSFASSQLSSSSFLRSVQESFLPPAAAAGTCVLSLSVGAAAAAVLLALNLFGNFLARARFHFSIRHQGSTSSVRPPRRRRDGGDESGIVNGVGVPPPLRPRPSVSVRPSVGEATSPPSDFHCRVIQCAYKPNQHLTVRPRPRPSPRPSGCVHACVQRAASGGGDVGTELLHDN